MLKHATRLRRELTMAQHIPYASHVSASVVRTVFGDYVQVLRLGGASFESADDEQLNGDGPPGIAPQRPEEFAEIEKLVIHRSYVDAVWRRLARNITDQAMG